MAGCVDRKSYEACCAPSCLAYVPPDSSLLDQCPPAVSLPGHSLEHCRRLAPASLPVSAMPFEEKLFQWLLALMKCSVLVSLSSRLRSGCHRNAYACWSMAQRGDWTRRVQYLFLIGGLDLLHSRVCCDAQDLMGRLWILRRSHRGMLDVHNTLAWEAIYMSR